MILPELVTQQIAVQFQTDYGVNLGNVQGADSPFS